MKIAGSKITESSPRQLLVTASSSGSGSSSRITRPHSDLNEELQHDIPLPSARRSFLIDAENSDSTENDGNNDDDAYQDAAPFEQLNEEDEVNLVNLLASSL